jgi:hypothetical protein
MAEKFKSALKYEDQSAAELARKGDLNALAKHYDALAKEHSISQFIKPNKLKQPTNVLLNNARQLLPVNRQPSVDSKKHKDKLLCVKNLIP